MYSRIFQRVIAVTCLLALLIGLFVGGAQPGAVGLFSEPWDKVAHASLFLVFALILRAGVNLPAWQSVAIAGLIGAADEFHQLYLPGRSAGLDDWAADLVGATLGVLIAQWLLRNVPGLRKDQ